MSKTHTYQIQLQWTGNLGKGTANYRAYSRDHELQATGKPVILGSSDPAFRGDSQRYNPEEQLVAALSSCHMLWYLHLCAEAGIVVVDYSDAATGTMLETEDGGGRFVEVTLHPKVSIQQSEMTEKALALHERAHELCFIANSVNFPVLCEGTIEVLS